MQLIKSNSATFGVTVFSAAMAGFLGGSRRQLVEIVLQAGWLFMLVAGFLTLIVGVFMFFRYPLMFNPFELIARLEAGTLEDTTVHVMAMLLPVVMSLVLFMLFTIIMLTYAVMSNDKKYLAIIDRQHDTDDNHHA